MTWCVETSPLSKMRRSSGGDCTSGEGFQLVSQPQHRMHELTLLPPSYSSWNDITIHLPVKLLNMKVAFFTLIQTEFTLFGAIFKQENIFFAFRKTHPHCDLCLLQSVSSWSNGAWPCGPQIGPPWSRFAITPGWEWHPSPPNRQRSRSLVTSASEPSTQTRRQAQTQAKRVSENDSGLKKYTFVGNEGVWMEGVVWTQRLAACSPTVPSVAESFTQLAQLRKCTLIFLFCREFLIYYHLFFLILFSPSLLFPLS